MTSKIKNNMQEKHYDFYLKEHGYLVDGLESRIQETRRLELAVIASTTAIWAWLATHIEQLNSANIIWPWWIPSFFALLAGFRCWMLLLTINRKSKYIKKIENHILEEGALKGWRNYQDATGSTLFTRSTVIFWLVFTSLVATLPIFILKIGYLIGPIINNRL